MSMIAYTVSDVREYLKTLYRSGVKADNDTYEIINVSFIADEPSIFGTVNEEYAKCEVDWYNSMSLNVFDMPCKTPAIWEKVSSMHGTINSNYGWCIFSEENFYQYQEAINCLVGDKGSRQSTMIYIRPTMHKDAFVDGMSDFMCTYAVQMIIRNNKLDYIVYMRSNDAVFGYKNDKYWHDIVFNKALGDLKKIFPGLDQGKMYWNAASLHVYPRHFHLLED